MSVTGLLRRVYHMPLKWWAVVYVAMFVGLYFAGALGPSIYRLTGAAP